jgi:hypothetical protein
MYVGRGEGMTYGTGAVGFEAGVEEDEVFLEF